MCGALVVNACMAVVRIAAAGVGGPCIHCAGVGGSDIGDAGSDGAGAVVVGSGAGWRPGVEGRDPAGDTTGVC